VQGDAHDSGVTVTFDLEPSVVFGVLDGHVRVPEKLWVFGQKKTPRGAWFF
jgi:hypothetical protein